MIDQKRMEAAMEFLADTDEEFAQEKMELEKAAILQKRSRARCFLMADGSVEQRKATAETAADTQAADDAYIACVKVYETLRAKRQRAELVLDIWRSLEASRRRA
jgi:peroxiredoxin